MTQTDYFSYENLDRKPQFSSLLSATPSPVPRCIPLLIGLLLIISLPCVRRKKSTRVSEHMMFTSPISTEIDEGAEELDGTLGIGPENILRREIVGSSGLHYLLNFGNRIDNGHIFSMQVLVFQHLQATKYRQLRLVPTRREEA